MSAAIAYLRRRTVWRSLHSYRVWVGRAIGWWSILYLIFWLVVFALSGAEMVTTLAQPFPRAVPLVAMLVVAVLFLALLASGRAPSVVLDRRDLFRVALAPTKPLDVIRYRMNLRRSLVIVGAAAVGGLWSFIAPHYFHVSAPWAAPAAALVALAYFEIGWLRYAGYRSADTVGTAARSAAAWLVSAAAATTALAVWTDYRSSLAGSADGTSGVGDVFALLGPLSALTHAS
ncbi:MAG TPA: hypothetical protein VFN03_12315, partial [Trueperaceae bacterium]|nr:hypothetical protein [Trueperaceae bacterium]